MNLRLEKKMSFLLLLALLLALALYAGSYFLYLSPLKDSLALKESQLKSEQQLSKTFENQLATANSGEIDSSVEMQEMLPVDPMIEQLILDIEKAEVISNSSIISIEFNATEDAIEADAAIEETQQTDQTAAQQADGTGTQVSEAPAKDINEKSQLIMPEGLSKTTVSIVVESDNYFDLEKFIETLETLKRVVMVESIAFSGPEELTSLVNEAEPIQMTIALNTFHLTGFDELNDYNPKIETPEPANKRNPFPTFGDTSDENLSEDKLDKEQDEQ